MKMLRAIIRPEKANEVITSLEKAGFYAYTRMDVMGRGRQKGIRVGSSWYEELSKTCLILVVEDRDTDRLLDILKIAARTGNPGDGKISVIPLAAVYSIRTRYREPELSL